MSRNRATIRKARLVKAHRDVISSGELFVRALAVGNDLSRRVLKQPGSKMLRSEQRRHEKLLSQLAREYKFAIAEYLAAIRAALK